MSSGKGKGRNHLEGPPPPVFTAREVRKVYDMGEVQVEALRGVDLELYAGELVVLLGPPGSGEPTLLNIPGGLGLATLPRAEVAGSYTNRR